jgi:hypothetical protein
MKDIESINFLEAVITVLDDINKSKDISSLLFEMDIKNADGILGDFVTELGLTASPEEEDGIGCYSLNHMKKALNEIKDSGETNLLEGDKS